MGGGFLRTGGDSGGGRTFLCGAGDSGGMMIWEEEGNRKQRGKERKHQTQKRKTILARKVKLFKLFANNK